MNSESMPQVREWLETMLRRKGESGADVDYACPFCEKDNRAGTLHVNWHKFSFREKACFGVAVCHQCWYKTSDVLRIGRDLFGYVPVRIEKWRDRINFAVDVRALLTPATVSRRASRLPASFRRLTRGGDQVAKRMWGYVTQERGVSEDAIDNYGIGYLADVRERAHGCVVFPFYARGRCVYWQARRVIGTITKKNKFWNPPATIKDSLLFGYDQAVGFPRVAIHESPFDVVCMNAGGLALTAKAIRPSQIREIALLGVDEVAVCLDADCPGDTRAIAEAIRAQTSLRVATLILASGDPDEHKGQVRVMMSKAQYTAGGGIAALAAAFERPVPRACRRSRSSIQERLQNLATRGLELQP